MTFRNRFRGAQRSAWASHPVALAATLAAGALAVCAVVNRRLATAAERDNPPAGTMVAVDGVRLHYVDRGRGEPLVLLHGNGSMIQDFASSGLIEMASAEHRVIVFDRPGFGHSARPRTTVWTPDAQAKLIRRALQRIGVSRALVLGHSWGASVAVALALNDPEMVRGLVLASGYYYPTARADVLALSGPAIPIIGDLARYTVSPIIGRVMWPGFLAKIFGPARVPAKFAGFPREMALRPAQIRANAAEAALMVPNAIATESHYASISVPTVIIAGEDDRLVDIDRQSARLHRDIAGSTLHRIPGAGHMVHQTATADVLAAIREVAEAARTR